MKEPVTLLEAVRYYSDLRVCKDVLAEIRWPDGPVCPRCESKRCKELGTRQIWKCYGCKKQFSVKVGTIFEDSPLGLDKWFVCLWQIANCRNGVSSYEIARALDVKQETAWFMLHRVRHCLDNGSFAKLEGTVEADETFIGGLAKNKHVKQRIQLAKGEAQPPEKTLVMGMVERDGRARAKVVKDQRRKSLWAEIDKNVADDSMLYTDSLKSYEGLMGKYWHESVNHKFEFVRGDVHTNSVENYWSLVKRMLKGTYIAVEPFHLDRYLTEQSFRYDHRKQDDGARFRAVLARVTGRRLTYEQLKTFG